jgi:serine/threonine-protein kinase
MYYYLLSARLPFGSDEISELILRHRYEPVPSIAEVVPKVPAAVIAILERCLAKRPEDRHASAGELAGELLSVISDLRDTETLVNEVVKDVDCFVQGSHDRYRIVIRLPGERLQEVYLESMQGRYGERLLSVFSVCGHAVRSHYEFALRLNDKLSFGGISVRDVNEQPMFVMNRTFPRQNLSAAEVRTAMLEIAAKSDLVEQQLSNVDVF